jgi:hypothetical protein
MRADGVAQAIQCLPSKLEALSSNPRTAPPPPKKNFLWICEECCSLVCQFVKSEYLNN